MTWVARGARAGTLSALAVGWGLLAHLGAGGHGAADGPHAALSPGALLWAGSATLLLAWFLVPPGRGSAHGPGTARLLVTVGAGQGFTHAALALAPLLGRQTRVPVTPAPGTGVVTGHAGHLPAVVGGTPAPAELLTVLGHGGTWMLLLHLLASVTVVVLWAAAAALWREATSWWGRLMDTGTVRVPVRPRRPAVVGVCPAPAAVPHLSWDGRAPPTSSAVP